MSKSDATPTTEDVRKLLPHVSASLQEVMLQALLMCDECEMSLDDITPSVASTFQVRDCEKRLYFRFSVAIDQEDDDAEDADLC